MLQAKATHSDLLWNPDFHSNNISKFNTISWFRVSEISPSFFLWFTREREKKKLHGFSIYNGTHTKKILGFSQLTKWKLIIETRLCFSTNNIFSWNWDYKPWWIPYSNGWKVIHELNVNLKSTKRSRPKKKWVN